MLEVAHNLLATPAEQLPPVPVMFLFSGAEEPLCQVCTRQQLQLHPPCMCCCCFMVAQNWLHLTRQGWFMQQYQGVDSTTICHSVYPSACAAVQPALTATWCAAAQALRMSNTDVASVALKPAERPIVSVSVPCAQSAAAFMALSPWATRAGVFINLESIGPGGSPIVFQHAGAWTIEAFAKGAVHPRGASAAQVGELGGF